MQIYDSSLTTSVTTIHYKKLSSIYLDVVATLLTNNSGKAREYLLLKSIILLSAICKYVLHSISALNQTNENWGLRICSGSEVSADTKSEWRDEWITACLLRLRSLRFKLWKPRTVSSLDSFWYGYRLWLIPGICIFSHLIYGAVHFGNSV